MESDSERVLCVGLCCLDIVMMCKSYPIEDSDQRCISHKWQRGGNASNNCTIFAEFNVPCEILGALSHDIGGEFMKKNFKDHNISFENCHLYKNCDTPTSCVWINSENGSRTIVHSNKNMPEITFDDFKVLDLQKYKWIHFECRPSIEDIIKMIDFIENWNSTANKNHITVSIEVEKPNVKFIELLRFPDIVFISKDFARVNGYSDKESAVHLLSQKIKSGSVIICPWGEKGAAAKRKDGQIVTSPLYSPNKVINTLGAGDTFVAATIMSIMKGYEISNAIEFGCKVAGTKCGMNDTINLSQLCPLL